MVLFVWLLLLLAFTETKYFFISFVILTHRKWAVLPCVFLLGYENFSWFYDCFGRKHTHTLKEFHAEKHICSWKWALLNHTWVLRKERNNGDSNILQCPKNRKNLYRMTNNAVKYASNYAFPISWLLIPFRFPIQNNNAGQRENGKYIQYTFTYTFNNNNNSNVKWKLRKNSERSSPLK